MKDWIPSVVRPGWVVLGVLLAGGGTPEALAQTNTTGMGPGPIHHLLPKTPPRRPNWPARRPGPSPPPRQPPPSLRLTPQAAEVTSSRSQVCGPSVLLAFVTNSPSPFNLGADEIIYLNDIGVSGDIVAAMMQRDKALKELASGRRAPTRRSRRKSRLRLRRHPKRCPSRIMRLQSYPPAGRRGCGLSGLLR